MTERFPRSIAERRVLVDTSAFLAIMDRRDERHRLAVQILERLADGRFHLFTTNYIVVEAHAAILSALGPEAGRSFLTDGLYLITRIKAKPADEQHGQRIIFTFRDKRYSLCDAVSFAVMERLGIARAFSFDDHFRQHGFSIPLGHHEWP